MSLQATKSRIFDVVSYIYEHDYLPAAKDVHAWVMTHESEFRYKIVDLVEKLASKHLNQTEDFDEDFSRLKEEITASFEWLHDEAVGAHGNQ